MDFCLKVWYGGHRARCPVGAVVGIVPVDDVEQTVFGPHVFPPFFQLIVVAGTVIMVPRVAHIHVFVDKGGDGYGSGCKPLVVVIPQPLEELVHVEQAGVGIAWNGRHSPISLLRLAGPCSSDRRDTLHIRYCPAHSLH